MIEEKAGRSRSKRTVEEDIETLQKELATLTPDERVVFEKLIAEMQAKQEGDKPALYQYLTDSEFKTPPVDMETFIRDPYFLGNTCDNLWPRLMDDLVELFEGGYHEVVYTGCIDLNAVVQGANGSLNTIREWIGKAGKVVGFRPEGPVTASTGLAKHSGTLPVLALELANGMAQKLTPNHKVMVWRDGYEWVPASELVEGDFAVVARRTGLDVQPDSKLTATEAKLLAYWCADGSSSEQRSRFCDGNPATSLEVLELLEQLGFSGKRAPKGDHCWEVYVEEHKKSGFLAWLREHNGHLPTKEVVVPDAVCRASNGVVSAFLSRLWAAEGTVYTNAAKSPPRYILSMTSERFIRQVQMLLLREGIQSRIQFTPQFDKRSGKTTESWILSVAGVGPLKRFSAFVGLIPGKEEACQKILSYVCSTAENTNVDIVPVRRKWLSEEMTRRGLVRARDSRWWGLSRGAGQYLSRTMFEEWLREYEFTELGVELKKAFPREFAFEKVVSTDPAGEIEVGDICDVEGVESFVSNGIYSHNSIGWGKTFTASIGIARILYELSCLKDPHKTYGLAKGSNISIVCLSVNEQLATKVVFENISIKIKASPYFQEHFPFEATKKELRFPGNIWVAARATTDTSALGLNTISALVDETNFMPTKGSKQLDRVGYVDHAEVIYNSIKRRMKSRFEKHGKLPGMLFIVSSKKTMDDFTARRVRESAKDASVFVRDYALWDVKPEDHYSQKRFWVIVGNDQTPSRIVRDNAEADALRETLPEGVVLIDVPEDFLPDFERDLEGSIRDLAGCATVSISPFIQRREKILAACEAARNHPFSVNVYDPSKPGTFMWDYMVSQQRERDGTGQSLVRSKPIVNPNAPRHIHIDPSLRGDSTGIAMAHVAGFKDVKRRSDDGREYMERAPIYYVDFVLRIIPPIGDEIIMGDVRRLVYDLSQHGYMITCVSMDSWQSADAMQQLKQRGYTTALVSVDTSTDPYENLKTALYEGRISLYHYEPLIKELQQLEKDTKKRKIDHPPKGSKDVSDALAGCLHTLSQQQTSQPLPILRGTAYYGEAWMVEQQQSSMTGALRNTDLRDALPSADMPLPFFTGNGRMSGGDGGDRGGGGNGGFGDF